MRLSRLFNTPIHEEVVRGAGPADATPAPTVTTFVTPQSLASFPVASLVVGLLTAALRTVLPAGAQTSTVVPFAIALVVGAIIFLISVRDPAAENLPRSRADWAIAIFVAFVNSVFLYMAAIGAIQTATGSEPDAAGG